MFVSTQPSTALPSLKPEDLDPGGRHSSAAGGVAHELATVCRPVDTSHGYPVPDRKDVLQCGDQVRKSLPVLLDALAVLGWAADPHI